MIHKKDLYLGPCATCTYILWDDEHEGCVVIDPAYHAEHIRRECEGRPIAAILLTHGHFDHIGAVRDLMAEGTELVIHRDDAPMLGDMYLNASTWAHMQITAPEATVSAREGSVLTYAGMTFTVLHTPGHTPGSVCYRTGNWLFTGDTYFEDGVYGRTDLPGGSMHQLAESLRRLQPLLTQCEIYPGH